MSPTQHQCIFYERVDELWGLCASLIQDCTSTGFKWLYIFDEHSPQSVKSAFESRLLPLPAGKVVNAGSLNLLDMPIYVDAVIDQVRTQARMALEEGFTGLFLLVEMTWSLRTSFGVSYLGEYEARLHKVLASLPMRAACLYNRRLFTESMILDVLRTHPEICTADGVYRNPHFLPPEAFLNGDTYAHLQYWLKAINPALADTWHQKNEIYEPTYPVPATVRPTDTAPKSPIYNLESLAPLEASNSREQRWKIHCLGKLEVYRQDGTLVRWNTIRGATQKVKTLFAYLLHRGQKGAAAEELADLLWPEASSTKQSLNRLYHTVHCLRKALSPELTSSRDSPFVPNRDERYFLALPAGTWVDIPVFEELCYKAEQLLRENNDEESLILHLAAERLYRGVLLADLPVEHTENLEDDWCWSRRYWLQEMYLKMLTYIAGTYRRRHDIPRALAYGEKVLSIDPCAERAHQEMMRIFHLAGRRDALDRQYQLCTQALRRYAGCAPSPTTQALYQSLAATLK